MHFSKTVIAAFVASSAMVMGAPTAEPEPVYAQLVKRTDYKKDTPTNVVANQCGNGSTLQCCNSFTKQTATGLLGVIVNVLSGNSCSQIPILAIPISETCTNKVACCSQQNSQTGLVNVGNVCTPINIL